MKKFIIELKDAPMLTYQKVMNPKCKACDLDPAPGKNDCICIGKCSQYKECNTAFKAEQRKRNKKNQVCNSKDHEERKKNFFLCGDCSSTTCESNCNKCPYFKICQEMYKNEKRPPKPKQPKHPFPWSRIPKDTTPSPTAGQGRALTLAFDHFNKELFGDQLTRPMLTLSRNLKSQLGYFSPLKWYNPKGEHAHELGINANLFYTQDIILFFTAFIHEMIHVYQYDITEHPGQPGNHNVEYVGICKRIGLKTIPQPGDNLHTELIEGGKAYKAILTLPKECIFPYMSHPSRPDGTPIPIPIPVPGGTPQPQPGGEGEEGEPGQGQCPGTPGETPGEPRPGGEGRPPQPGKEDIPRFPDGTPVPQPKPGGEGKVVNIPMTGKRAKYTCPLCGLNAWAKPGVKIYCHCNGAICLVEVKG